MIGKAALRRVQLIGRDADIKQDTVCAGNTRLGGDARHVGKIGLTHKRTWVSLKPLCDSGDGVGILIDGEQETCLKPVKDGLRVAPSSRRAVDIDAVGADLKGINRFVKQNGNMLKRHWAALRLQFQLVHRFGDLVLRQLCVERPPAGGVPKLSPP